MCLQHVHQSCVRTLIRLVCINLNSTLFSSLFPYHFKHKSHSRLQMNWIAAAHYAQFLSISCDYWPLLSRYMYLSFMQMHLASRCHSHHFISTDHAIKHFNHHIIINTNNNNLNDTIQNMKNKQDTVSKTTKTSLSTNWCLDEPLNRILINASSSSPSSTCSSPTSTSVSPTVSASSLTSNDYLDSFLEPTQSEFDVQMRSVFK